MIKLDKVFKKFGTGVLGLSDVNFTVDKNEFVFLVGPTGSGKTTIFKLLIRETLPTQGDVLINDWSLVKLSKDKIPHLRKRIGVVFQDLRLLFDRTIFENVMLPLDVAGIGAIEAKKKVEEVLAQVGIIDHKDKFPIQLSGGELQRAAIARALVLSPELLLADEPTGNLDPATSWEIVRLLAEINAKGTTVIMATHNTDIIKNMNKRVVGLDKGKIVRDDKKKTEDTPAHKSAYDKDSKEKPEEHPKKESKKEPEHDSKPEKIDEEKKGEK
ncbi:MAG: ATP-binding cassette domain-containing protein [Patescibacteria group bacterium]